MKARAARDRLRQQARALVQQRFELFGKPATEAFMTEVTVQRGSIQSCTMTGHASSIARVLAPAPVQLSGSGSPARRSRLSTG